MFGLIGNIAGAAFGGPVGSMVGGAIGNALDGAGKSGGGQQAEAFEKALSGFAMQIAGDATSEMQEAMNETEEDFA